MTPALLVGTEDGLYELDSPDRERRLPGRQVSSLIPAHGGGWWVVLDRRFIARSADGVEWREVAEFTGVEAACLAADGEQLWIGTHPPHIYRLSGDSLDRVEPFEDVPGKESWFTPWGGPPETRSLALTPDGTIFANVHVGGIPRGSFTGSDGDAIWQPTIEVRADVHQVIVHPDDPRLVLAASARGLGVSRDAGDSWQMHRQGVHGHYMSAVAVAGSIAFVTSSTGSSLNARSAIYWIDLDNPVEFIKSGDGLPEWFTGNINTFCLMAHRDTLAFGTRDGKVFAAAAGDLAWRELARDLPAVLCVRHLDEII